MEIHLVKDRAALAQLCDRLAPSPWVALDTEFTRESTYYARLGLLQVATEKVTACVDPLAVDLAPLLNLLYNPLTLKVIHAGRQDLEVLYDLRHQIPQPLFDTQIAAALLGYPTQIGYAALVEALIGVKLPKLHTPANWEARPLSEEQLRYASDDVLYLKEVYRKLDGQIRERGREGWLAEECAALADPALYRADPDTAYARLNPGRAVPPAAQPLLRSLAAWRERTAQTRDRPRSWIAADAVLIEIARQAPADRQSLERLPQISATFIQKHGGDILKLVEEMRGAPPERVWPDARPPTAAEQDQARRMLDRVSAVAQAHQINPEIIATRRAVFALIRDRAGPLTRGWRYQLIGKELLATAN